MVPQREIRVASKRELIDRIHQYFQEINAEPVVFLHGIRPAAMWLSARNSARGNPCFAVPSP